MGILFALKGASCVRDLYAFVMCFVYVIVFRLCVRI